MVKALFENLYADSQTSFLAKSFLLERFTVPYHFHPEYELTLIVQGNGKRYVGKNMEDYDSGDLVFLGSELPHCWKSDESAQTEQVQSIVIQFEKDFLGRDFFSKPELFSISELMKRSAYGIRFLPEAVQIVKPKMEQLVQEQNAFRRLFILLDILEYLAGSNGYTLLDRDGMVAQQTNTNKERINAALGYIVENFRKEILLHEVSATVNMSPNAFCKYFKRLTGKTFIETVIDYRIDYAIQQLLATDKSISEISFDSGFGDVSHFHKLFKRKTKMSPMIYRKSFQRGL
jgi:AraC-like DNA-binding protein